MRIEALQEILAIAGTGSISKAAEKTDIRKTSLSSTVKSVEQEVGYQLFRRSSSGVQLTEKGQAFIRLASEILDSYSRMLELGTADRQPFTVYVNHSVSELFYREVYGHLYRSFPDLKLRIYRIPPETYIYQHKASDSMRQIAIDCYPVNRFADAKKDGERNGFVMEYLHTFRLMAYINRRNPLSELKSVTLPMLMDQNLLFGVDPSIAHPGVVPTFGSGYKSADGAGFVPLMRMVHASDMVGVFPEYRNLPFAEEFNEYTDIVPVPITGEGVEEITYEQCLIHPGKMRLAPEEKALVARIREVFGSRDGAPDGGKHIV